MNGYNRNVTSYVLLAAGGPGGRIAIGDVPITVGRARSCDLVLRDPSVSRHHLRVRAVTGGVELVCEPGAGPILYRGQPRVEVIVGAADHVVVGSTILTVASADAEVAPLRSELETAVGVDADVRGLSAIVSLLEELAAATELEAAIAPWARATFGVPAHLAVTPTGFAVPAGSRWLVVELAGEIDRATRSLAAVAGAVIADALATVAIRAESAALRDLAVGSARRFLGGSLAAAEVDRLVRKLAASDATALILGESGTGKTFAARLIHEASARARAPLRVLNCAAIPEALLESELFGAERGAFSGAVATRLGAFEAVGDGTLLLDEIGELSLASQAKLLRAIEERTFERVGSNRPIELRARILAATNRDLRAMSDAGTFRKDLYFRVSVITLGLPPLRDRPADVTLLAERMLADLAASAPRRISGFTSDALRALAAYSWPGNARELRNAIEHALVLGETPQIELGDLPELVRTARGPASGMTPTTTVELPADLRWLEERAIAAALEATAGNRTKAAAILGINRVTLQKKLAK